MVSLATLVGRVGLEPTKPEASDLQSDVIAAIRPTHMAIRAGFEPATFSVTG